MKYYLLTFNEDWADEINVPALECMTEVEFNNWTKGSKVEEEITDEMLKAKQHNKDTLLKVRKKQAELIKVQDQIRKDVLDTYYDGVMPKYTWVNHEDSKKIKEGLLDDPNRNYIEFYKIYNEMVSSSNIHKGLQTEIQNLWQSLISFTTVSKVEAWLGNFDTDSLFGEDYNDYLTGQDFIDKGTVKVTEVTEEFYNIFKETNLSNLSLSNIFEI